MIIFHPAGEKGIECRDLGHSHALMGKAVWIDLFKPTEQEEIIVDMAFSIDLPTPREMQDIEVSRRLYKEDGALFMTATVLTKADTSEPESAAVTFIFVDNRLITLRYADPSVFKIFRKERESNLALRLRSPHSGRIGRHVDRKHRGCFGKYRGRPRQHFARYLSAAWRSEGFGARTCRRRGEAARSGRALLPAAQRSGFQVTRESGRPAQDAFVFHRSANEPSSRRHRAPAHSQPGPSTAGRSRFVSLAESELPFGCDPGPDQRGAECDHQNLHRRCCPIPAADRRRNDLRHELQAMPELKWVFGYPFAIVLMILSAIVPYWYFKRRRWF